MHNKAIKEIIESLAPVSSNSLAAIEDLLEYEDYSTGDVFIKKGKTNSKEYFLLDGICKSYLLSPEGEEISLTFFTTKSVLSPYVTRTVNSISNMNFQALSDLQLASIDTQKFEALMVDLLDIRTFGNNVLRSELQQKVNKEIGMASLTAKERLILFRQQYPLLENLIPHTAIASYLGITNISLSRLRKELIK